MTSKSLAKLMEVAATERRVEILRELLRSHEPLAVTILATRLGLTDAQASFNLNALARVGLVTKSPSGKYAFYSANKVVLRELVRFWRTRKEEE